MGKLKVPSNVTSITVSGSTLTPDASGRITHSSDVASTTLLTTKPQVVYSKANGDVVIKLASNITSITIGGIVYTPDGVNQITVPASAATAFLTEAKYAEM